MFHFIYRLFTDANGKICGLHSCDKSTSAGGEEHRQENSLDHGLRE